MHNKLTMKRNLRQSIRTLLVLKWTFTHKKTEDEHVEKQLMTTTTHG